MNILKYRTTCKKQWKIILVHFICTVLFVISGLIMETIDNVFGFSHYLWFTVVGFTKLLHRC